METYKDNSNKDSRFQEQDLAGFRFSRKRQRQIKELSPDYKRRRSGQFFVRQTVSSEDVDVQPSPCPGGESKTQTEITSPSHTLSTSSTGHGCDEPSNVPRDTMVEPHGDLDSQVKTLISQLDECSPILDSEIEKLIEEKKQWVRLVDVYKSRTSAVCRDADAEPSIKLAPDGLPLALLDTEREFLSAQPNVQEIIDRIETSHQEMEQTMSLWAHNVSMVEQLERCIEVCLSQETQKIAKKATAQMPDTPRNDIRAILDPKISLSDSKK